MGNMGVVLDRFLGPSVMAAIAMAVLFIARGIIVHLLKNPSDPLSLVSCYLVKALHKRYTQDGIAIPMQSAG